MWTNPPRFPDCHPTLRGGQHSPLKGGGPSRRTLRKRQKRRERRAAAASAASLKPPAWVSRVHTTNVSTRQQCRHTELTLGTSLSNSHTGMADQRASSGEEPEFVEVEPTQAPSPGTTSGEQASQRANVEVTNLRVEVTPGVAPIAEGIFPLIPVL